MRLTRFLHTVIASSLLCSTALAQRDTATAQAMFDQAREAMKANDFAKACPKFAESHRLDPQPGTLANLAICEEKNGAVASAWSHARDAIDQLGGGDDRVPALKALVGRVEKRLPRLVVRIAPGSPPETRVRRDSVDLGPAALGEALPVDPGDHVILASAPGRKDRMYKVAASEGRVAAIEVGPGEVDDSTPAVVPTKEGGSAPEGAATRREADGSRRTIGYVLGGVGVAGVAVGVATTILLAGKKSTVEDQCNTESKRCAGPDANGGVQAASSGQSLLPVFYAGWAVGVIGIASGAYFLLTPDPKGEVSLRVGPSGASVGGRF